MTPMISTGIYTEIQEKKLLLKQAQPPSFNGEGPKVEQDVEVWVEAMFDYFSALLELHTQTNPC